MKKEILLFLIVLIFLSNIFYVSAQEPARYNFGTSQPNNMIEVELGKSASTKIYFYNLWGNRITHIKLNVEEKTEEMEIKISPELHNVTLNITGVLITIQENLYAVPCEIDESWCATNDTSPREGVDYISASGISGKIPAKYVLITVKVPKNFPLWKNWGLKISAVASWYGEAGTVALTQARDFDYTVRTVTKEYSEEYLKEKEGKSFNWMYVIYAVIVLVIIFLLIKFIKKKKKHIS